MSTLLLKLPRFSPDLVASTFPKYAAGMTNWSLWPGEDRDPRWDSLTEVDVSKIVPVTCLRDVEPYIDGYVHEQRIKDEYPGMIRVEFNLALALRLDTSRFPSAWNYLDLYCGPSLRDPNGKKYVPVFHRQPVGHAPVLMGARPWERARGEKSRTLLLSPD